MPASPFHGHPLLGVHQPPPHVLKSPPASLRDVTDVSPSPSPWSPSPSPASLSRPSSGLDVLGPDVNAMSTGTPRSVPGNRISGYQSPISRGLVDRVLGHLSSPPSRASPPATSSDIVLSNAVQVPDPHGSAASHSTLFASPSSHDESARAHYAQVSMPTSYATSSWQSSLNSGLLNQSSSRHSPEPQYQKQGMFSQAHNFTVVGSTFLGGDVNHVNISGSNKFMAKLLEKTIPGAEFDSSDRDPPPRCHPGTRLAILQRCLHFIHNCNGEKKIRWLVSAAGAGKSAIMQSVAESPELPVSCHASVFFSINGRSNGNKAILTISYQFAVKSGLYRQLIEKEIINDPSLLRSSIAKQFFKFIIEPFIRHPPLNSAGRVLIIIDGLDECHSTHTQIDLLHLISDSCIKYPSLPFVWLIASRPETHITSFFSRAKVTPVYEKEEILIDSDEGRRDVERFLRNELMEINKGSDSLDPHWPEERKLWKLANASGGLFAYAQTVVRYIGDSRIGSPASQLSDVLNVIDNYPIPNVPREHHPLASLDALYARILSNIPSKVMMNTRKLLLTLASNWGEGYYLSGSFIVLCNWLGMTPDDAYAAVNHLRSVLYVPRHSQARRETLQPFHKSFIDYICDFPRSNFSYDIKHEAQQLRAHCASRILKEAPDGVDCGRKDYPVHGGNLVCSQGTGDNILLTWPINEVDWNDDKTKLRMYKIAIGEVVVGMKRGDPTLQEMFHIRLLTTRFWSYHDTFPYYEFRDFVFHMSRRDELTMHGILKQISLREISISHLILGLKVKAQFRHIHPATKTNLRDPWRSSCTHRREGLWGEGKDQDWVTTFSLSNCTFCFKWFKYQLVSWKTKFPEYSVPILFSSTGRCCVEVRFVDPDNGISEWIYWVRCRISLDVCREYGSTV